MRHKLLVKQVRHSLGVTSEKALQERLAQLRARGDADLADGLQALFSATEQSYQQYDRDLKLRTRMLEISSDELTSANDQLRSEATRQRAVLQSLQNSVHRLTYGSAGPIEPEAEATIDFDKDLLRLTHVLEDLVQQRETARDALAATEAANRRILNSLREVVFQTDLAGRLVFLNPAWTHITGFSVAESLGQRALSYIHPDDYHKHVARLSGLVAREEHHFREHMRHRTSDGGYRWLEVFARRIEDERGQVAGLTGSLIDITEQKLAQDQLVISEQRLNQALKATDTRLWDWDMRQEQPYVDPAWLANLGYPPDHPGAAEIEWHKQMHQDDAPRWREHLREHLRRLRPELDLEIRFATYAGEWRYTALRGKIVAWEGGRAVRMAGTLQDISARKEAEEAALRQQELTEQILDQLPIPVFLKDREGRFVRFNRHFQQYSQLSREDMLGQRIEDFASRGWSNATQAEDALAWDSRKMITSERRLTNVDPPVDLMVNRIVITSGGQSYLLGFSIDISEQRAARDAMQRAVESAQAASRAKSDFLANMSHEIRTPMNGILGMTELVLESALTHEQREDIALVKASADALLNIINDILDFSKIEAGKLDIEEVPFDPRKLVQETVKSMALRAQQKSLALSCELPEDLPRTMKGDPGRLRQVLINLLGNAIKFTAEGKVMLTLRMGQEIDERREVEFAVSDTGIGIPPDKQKLIFEAFSQVDGSTTREYGGTGLGLTICRRLVILMRGQMEVVSAPGQGSTFRFTVPLKQTGVGLQASLPLSWLDGKAVLLVDPDESSRHELAAMLRACGLRVTDCASAALAHKQLALERPALIVLDGDMPDLDAFSGARLPLRPPLLLIDASQHARADALRFSPDARVVRPLTEGALADAILTLLGDQTGETLAAIAPLLPLAPLPTGLATGAGGQARGEAGPAPEAGRADGAQRESERESGRESGRAADAGRHSGLRILLAEDNPVNQRLALRLLEKMGHRATLVDNGLSALERALQQNYDLILMDVQMPGLDGLSVTRHIRQREMAQGGHVPIIAMTARAMQGDRESCLEAGMDDYLSKPIDSARLRELIAQFDGEAFEPVLDWRSALGRLDGDHELLRELASIFLEDGPSLLAELHKALAAGDLVASQRAVHSLKGVLVNFGAQRAVAQTERLTNSLHAPSQAPQWRVLADALAPALDEVYAALREQLAAPA